MKWWKFLILIVVVVAALVFLFTYKSCNDPARIDQTSGQDVTYWKDKYGHEVASQKKTSEELARANLDRDSLAKLYNTKAKRIIEYVNIVSKSVDTIYSTHDPVVVYEKDSSGNVRMLRQVFENPYYLVEATIDRYGDSSQVLLESIDTLTVLWHKVREGSLFNRRTFYQVDIKNANPNNHILQINSFRQAAAKPKKFGIGVQVGYGFSGISPKPYIGVGVSYNLIRF